MTECVDQCGVIVAGSGDPPVLAHELRGRPIPLPRRLAATALHRRVLASVDKPYGSVVALGRQRAHDGVRSAWLADSTAASRPSSGAATFGGGEACDQLDSTVTSLHWLTATRRTVEHDVE